MGYLNLKRLTSWGDGCLIGLLIKPTRFEYTGTRDWAVLPLKRQNRAGFYQRSMKSSIRKVWLLFLFAVGLAMISYPSASFGESGDPNAGRRLWINGACASCHGRNGQGGAISADFPNGPSLRKSLLDETSMREVIGCGVPGTRMNAWLRGAFTERTCLDAPIGVLPAGTVVIGLFDSKEIAILVDFIQLEFVQPQ